MKIFNKEINKEQVVNGLKTVGKIAAVGVLTAVTYVVGFGSGMKHAEDQQTNETDPAELPEGTIVDEPEEEEPEDESNEEESAE